MKKLFKELKRITEKTRKDLVSDETAVSGEFYFDADCGWIPKPMRF